MKKIVRIVLVLVVLVGAGTAIWFGVRKERQADPNRLTLYGNVDIRQVSLAFTGSERIAEILVHEGDSVTTDQVLARLETKRFELASAAAEAKVAAQKALVDKLTAGTRAEEIQKARAEVEAARIQAANARRTARRLGPLAAKNLASDEQADDARSSAEAAEARLKSAQETLNLALAGPRKEDIAAAKATLEAYEAELAVTRKNLADAELLAPAPGVIQNRILEPGDMASPQRPVLTLALTDPVWVRIYLSETNLGRVFPGMTAEVVTDSRPDTPYPGWLGYISPSAEFTPKAVETPELRTHLVYQARVFVKNPDRYLRLGMPVTVRMDLTQSPTETPKAASRQ